MSSRKKLWVGYVTAKRSFDILVSCVFLLPSIVIAWTSALFVVLIDKQNPFFVQKRTVNNDQIFDTYKIRTMKNGIITSLVNI